MVKVTGGIYENQVWGSRCPGSKEGRKSRAYKPNRVAERVLKQVTPNTIGGGRAKVGLAGVRLRRTQR